MRMPGEAVPEMRAERLSVVSVARKYVIERVDETAAPHAFAIRQCPVEVPQDELGHQLPMPKSRSASFSDVRRSVDSCRCPMISAHDRWYVPAGNSFGRVPGTTTARGGT